MQKIEKSQQVSIELETNVKNYSHRSSFSVHPYGDISAVIDFVGILVSHTLISGVNKESSMKLFWWIVFQCISICIQIVSIGLLYDFIRRFDALNHYAEIIILVILLYNVLQVYFTIAIFKLSATYRVSEGNRGNPTGMISFPSIQSAFNDKPPSYEEVMQEAPTVSIV